jgi:hypothetical protein
MYSFVGFLLYLQNFKLQSPQFPVSDKQKIPAVPLGLGVAPSAVRNGISTNACGTENTNRFSILLICRINI